MKTLLTLSICGLVCAASIGEAHAYRASRFNVPFERVTRRSVVTNTSTKTDTRTAIDLWISVREEQDIKAVFALAKMYRGSNQSMSLALYSMAEALGMDGADKHVDTLAQRMSIPDIIDAAIYKEVLVEALDSELVQRKLYGKSSEESTTSWRYKSQLGNARDAQRRSDVNTILNGIYQYAIDNNGDLPEGITSEATEICRTDAGNCGNLVDLSELLDFYFVSIPEDPAKAAGNATGYTVEFNSETGRVTVRAKYPESIDEISVTR